MNQPPQSSDVDSGSMSHEPQTSLDSETTHADSLTVPASRIPAASWLIAGVLTALLVPVVVGLVVKNWTQPLPAEFGVNATERATTAEALRDEQLMGANKFTNQRRFMFSVGSCVAVVFGMFVGIVTGRSLMGVIGSVVAVAVAFGLATLVVPLLINLDGKFAGSGDSGDIPMMGRHAAAWALFAASAFVSVSIASGRLIVGGKVFGMLVLGGLVAAVIYVMGASILQPGESLVGAIPIEGASRWIWTSLAPLLGAVFLARTSNH